MWEAEIIAPIAQTSLNIFNIVNDSNLTSRNDSVLIVFRQNLSPLVIDTLLSLDVKPFIRNVKLDSISLNDQHISYRQTLGEVVQPLGMADGTNFIVLPPISNQTITDTIDGSNYFNSLDLRSGMMRIKLVDSFPMNITNISYTITNKNSGVVVHTKNYASIPKGSTIYDSADLSGKQIEGKLIVSFVFSIPLSFNVTIHYSDFVDLTVSLVNLKLNSAEAIFPSQTIIDHQENVGLLDMGDREVTFAHVESGRLRIRVVSTIGEITHFSYSIPNAKQNGIPFYKEMTLPAAPLGASITEEFIYAFDNFDFDFRGKDLDTFNAFFNQVLGRIDSTGNLVYLTLDDSVDIIVEILDLKPGYARGYLGSDTFAIGPASINFPELQKFKLDSMPIYSAKIALNVENSLGMPGNIKIGQVKAVNSRTTREVLLNTSSLPAVISIAKAVEGPPLHPVLSRFVLSNQNSNPAKLISILPDKFEYSLSVMTHPEGNSGLRDDFAYASNTLNTFLDIEIPLAIDLKGITLIDTVPFLSENVDDLNNIKRGIINFIVTNGYPFEASINIEFTDIDYKILHSLTSVENIDAAPVDAMYKRVTRPQISKLAFIIDDAHINYVLSANHVIMRISLKTSPENTFLQIFTTYSIDIKATGDFDHKFKGIN